MKFNQGFRAQPGLGVPATKIPYMRRNQFEPAFKSMNGVREKHWGPRTRLKHGKADPMTGHNPQCSYVVGAFTTVPTLLTPRSRIAR